MTTTNGVTYTYNWLAISSKLEGTETITEEKMIKEYGTRSIYEVLNRWNRLGAGIWQYWI